MCRAKYSATAVVDLGELLVGRGVLVERRSSPVRHASAAMPSPTTSFVISLEARDACLAAAQAERHEAVERRPDLAGAADVRAAPAAAVSGLREARRRRHVRDRARPPASTRRRAAASPLHSAVSAANAASPAGVRVRRRLGAAHRRAVGVAGAVHVPARRHDAEVGRAPRRARAVEPERRDAHPHRVGRARRDRARACRRRRACRTRRRRRRAARRARDRRPRARRPACPRSTPGRRCR